MIIVILIYKDKVGDDHVIDNHYNDTDCKTQSASACFASDTDDAAPGEYYGIVKDITVRFVVADRYQ